MNWIVKNILKAFAFVVGICLVASVVLAVYTRHNKEIVVPDFSGLSLDKASSIAVQAGVRLEVYDSAFVHGMAPGAVFSQNPSGGSMVKRGRRVLLTINAKCARMVSMPSLVGLSMRQARSELNSRSLALGRLIYVEDMATNNVLGQQIGGADVAPGTMIPSGTKVDLRLGLEAEDSRTFVPNVVGMRLQLAVESVQESSLNVGRLVFMGGVRSYSDSLTSVVYDQKPCPSEEAVPMGSAVTLYLKNAE